MNITEVFIAIITLLVAPLTGVVTWRLSRRKNEVEADSTIASGAQYAVDAMVSVMAELRVQVEDIKTEAELLREENAELKEQVRQLSAENRRLATDIERLTATLMSRCPQCESKLNH